MSLLCDGEEESRIVGGETAKKPYPYQISLQVKIPVYIAIFPTGRKEWMHNCGGKKSIRQISFDCNFSTEKLFYFQAR